LNTVRRDEVVQHMSFNIGRALECLWHREYKDPSVEDMREAIQYLLNEIERRKGDVRTQMDSDTMSVAKDVVHITDATAVTLTSLEREERYQQGHGVRVGAMD